MQRSLLYCFFAIAVLFGATAAKADTSSDALQVVISADRTTTHIDSLPFLSDQSSSSGQTALVRLVRQSQGSRPPTSYIKPINNGSRLLQLHHFSQTINQISIAEEAYITYYSHKQQNGHYLFALRRLRI